MIDRELLKVAIEALEHGGPAHRLHAIHALRAALAEPEQEPVAPARRPLSDADIKRIDKSIPANMMLPEAKRLFARLIEQAHGIREG